jgi:dihydrofolate synthase/folylpolyglutamate synthase
LQAEWPARLQRLTQGPLVSIIPAGAELWVDGGHNPDGARAVAAALADLEERVSRPLILVVGMLASKDHSGFLRNFSGLARRIIAVPIPHQEKSLPAETVADTARRLDIPATSRGSVEEALATTVQLGLDPPPRILITGSLYLAGEVLAANRTPPN